MTDEQKASIEYAADWLSRSEDIGNQKHADRLRALLAASAPNPSAEPVVCATCQDGALLPQYGVAPHDCYHKIGKPIGGSEVHAPETWPDNFEIDHESNGECGVFHCPDCGPKFKAGKPVDAAPLANPSDKQEAKPEQDRIDAERWRMARNDAKWLSQKDEAAIDAAITKGASK